MIILFSGNCILTDIKTKKPAGGRKERYQIMNEKMKEALKSIWENLTNEQKEKWKACKSEEEFLAFVDNEGIRFPDNVEGEVTDDDVEAIAGGGWMDWLKGDEW